MKFKTIVQPDPDSWSPWSAPLKKYKLCCCDCGLVHNFEFQVLLKDRRILDRRKGTIWFRLKRDIRSTAAVRRELKKKLESGLPTVLNRDMPSKKKFLRSRLARKDIARVMEALLEGHELQKVTLYLSPTFVVRATRQHKPDGRSKSWTVLFTFGKPNYREKEFIASCLKAGEPFPVKKLQLRWYR